MPRKKPSPIAQIRDALAQAEAQVVGLTKDKARFFEWMLDSDDLTQMVFKKLWHLQNFHDDPDDITYINQLETFRDKHAKIAELSKILTVSILNKTFEEMNAKLTKPEPAKTPLARSYLVQVRGSGPVIIEDFQVAINNGKLVLWGSNQSEFSCRVEEIEHLEPSMQAPKLSQLAQPSISELPPAPSEEDEFAQREESPNYKGVDYHDF
jgi:hypothetical protein